MTTTAGSFWVENKTWIKAQAASVVMTGMLGAVVLGAPSWFSNLTYTLCWLFMLFLLFATTVLGIIWGWLLVKGGKLIAPENAEVYTSIEDLADAFKFRKRHYFGWALTAVQIILLYMAGFSGLGATYLIVSILVVVFAGKVVTTVREITRVSQGATAGGSAPSAPRHSQTN
jgi:hypothetical protein